MGIELERKWMDLVLTRFQAFAKARGFRFVRNKNLQADMEKPVDQIPNDDRHELMIRFYDLCWRVSANGGRIVKCCNGIACPKCLKVGFNQLKRELKRGENLLPRMSRRTEKLDAFDAMDMVWGVRHFHLGSTPDLKHPGLISGTEEIAYVFLPPAGKYAYIIDIDKHGRWTDERILEKLDDNFPEALTPYKINGCELSYEVTGDERQRIRELCLNSPTRIKDFVIYSPYGGVSTAGTNTIAFGEFQHDREIIRQQEDLVLATLKNPPYSLDEMQLGKLILVDFCLKRCPWVELKDEANGKVYGNRPNGMSAR